MLWRWAVCALLAAWLGLTTLLAGPGTALADERVALVIGNSAYQNASALPNPVRDAAAVAAKLEEMGFDHVDLRQDLNQQGLKSALQEFARRASGADVAVVFYAGHGMETDGENFLIPVDATLGSDQDIDFELIPLDLVRRSVSGAKHLKLVILDACRNNPFAAQMAGNGTRAIGRGLSRVEAGNNELIAYAAKEGTVADDGAGGHSPFTSALLQHIGTPGLEISFVFRKVRDAVLSNTGGRQEPYVYGSLSGEETYLVAGLTPEAVPGATAPAALDKEMLFWDSIKDSSDPAEFEAYLEQYPTGTFAKLAEAKIAKLKGAAPTPTQEAAVSPEVVPGDAIEIEALDHLTYVARQAANVRAQPSTDAQILWRLKEDDDVIVTGKVKNKDWYRVPLSETTTGYVSTKLLAQAEFSEVAAWHALKLAPSTEALQAFLEEYPTGYFKPKAEALLASLVPPKSPSSGVAVEPSAPSAEFKPGETFRDCPDCPEMVVIPAGSFTMGSPDNEVERDVDEGPQHTVTILRSFAVGKFEVTVAEFRQFAHDSGLDSTAWPAATFPQGDNHPAVNVSWDDAQSFVRWLSQKTGKRYRLLTESEWEYAARAGTQVDFTDADNYPYAVANGGQSREPSVEAYEYTSPVGSFPANGFGLYDMLGNVWERVEDCSQWYPGAPLDGYVPDYVANALAEGNVPPPLPTPPLPPNADAPLDGSAPDVDCVIARHVKRGGSWIDDFWNLRPAKRDMGDRSDFQYQDTGFRVARSL